VEISVQISDLDPTAELFDAAVERLILIRDKKRAEEVLDDRARQAWVMMRRESEAMPPAVALDYVQDLTDDRAAALHAICRAVVVELANARPEAGAPTSIKPDWQYCAGQIGAALDCADIDLAAKTLADFSLKVTRMSRPIVLIDPPETIETPLHPIARQWVLWCDDCSRAVDLCRQLAEAQ
jgi:hypothetical protein